jgi:cell division cycle 2-like
LLTAEEREKRHEQEERKNRILAANKHMEDRRKEADARKKTREIEKEMYRLEEALKRKAEGRSRSSSREKKKKKKKKKKSETPEEESGGSEEEEEEVAAEAEKSTEEGEEEEEEEEDGSDEESSDEESESEEEAEGSDATTGSQKSEETPDREDTSEEGELENEDHADGGAAAKVEDGKEKRRRKRSHSPVEGKWADHSPDSNRTLSRSPTPLRAMSDNDSDRTPRRQQFHARDEESALSRPSSPGGHHYPLASPAASPIPLKDELPPYLPSVHGCRSVAEFKCLNRIEEGTYGVVYRARDKRTQEIVALKRLKMEREKEGFPITSLREINTLLISQHPNVVTVREIVVGSNMDQIYIVMDFVHHDLKSLMETMRKKNQVFLVGEVKCLMVQLLRAIHHLHDNWILHRDLKASNLLLSHNGILKVRLDHGFFQKFFT